MKRWRGIALAVILLFAGTSGSAPAADVGVSATVAGPEPVVISDLSCTPQPFDPTAGSASISFSLSTAATATGVITGTYGDLVAILGPADCAQGYNHLEWDGRNLVGSLVDPTWYTCSVRAMNGLTEDTAACTIAVSYGSPVRLSTAQASPKVLREANDTCILSVRLTRTAKLSIEIADSTGQAVWGRRDVIWGPGVAETAWNLRDSNGQRVPLGRYTITFTAVDSGDNVASASTFVQVKQ